MNIALSGLVGAILIWAVSYTTTASFPSYPVKIKIIRPLLPRRVPGASLVTNPPPENPELHTNPAPKLRFTKRILIAIKKWWDSLIIEDSESLGLWWAKTELQTKRRAYKPKHYRKDLLETGDYRLYWASYDTQAWPTLATTGNAWDPELVPPTQIDDTFIVNQERIEYSTGEATMQSFLEAWGEVEPVVIVSGKELVPQ